MVQVAKQKVIFIFSAGGRRHSCRQTGDAFVRHPLIEANEMKYNGHTYIVDPKTGKIYDEAIRLTLRGEGGRDACSPGVKVAGHLFRFIR